MLCASGYILKHNLSVLLLCFEVLYNFKAYGEYTYIMHCGTFNIVKHDKTILLSYFEVMSIFNHTYFMLPITPLVPEA
jgi:hypothetical protein